MEEMGSLDQIAPNLCKFIPHDPHSKDICEMLSSIMEYNG